jgi:hypothetical protein
MMYPRPSNIRIVVWLPVNNVVQRVCAEASLSVLTALLRRQGIQGHSESRLIPTEAVWHGEWSSSPDEAPERDSHMLFLADRAAPADPEELHRLLREVESIVYEQYATCEQSYQTQIYVHAEALHVAIPSPGRMTRTEVGNMSAYLRQILRQ